VEIETYPPRYRRERYDPIDMHERTGILGDTIKATAGWSPVGALITLFDNNPPYQSGDPSRIGEAPKSARA
jgi:hypothetical protein